MAKKKDKIDDENVNDDKVVKMVKCKFCGGDYAADDLIYGKTNTINICPDCLKTCNSIVNDRGVKKKEQSTDVTFLKPREIKEKLDEYIIEQNHAKKVISVAVYNHYKRAFNRIQGDVDVQKTNIALIGPTGCGKTLIAKTIAKLLDVPFVTVDATAFTQTGYIGRNVEDMLTQLVAEADGDVEAAERGIIFIDEVDKIAACGGDRVDVSGEGVQRSLLKIIEGNVIHVQPEGGALARAQQEPLRIDTSNILFIFGGAFVGLDKVISDRLSSATVGFGSPVVKFKVDGTVDAVVSDDLIKFGMTPEFVGRIQTIATLQQLSEETLIRILNEPKDALVKQYKALMNADEVKLDFTDDALKSIAGVALKRKTGARGLKSILEQVMLDIMYDAPSVKRKQKVTITSTDVEQAMG